MATVAKNKQDVDNMTTRERLWDSLSNAYGTKIEQSDESYDKAISQADRQALSRGMQRSSYNNQTLANLGNQKVKAQNDIRSELIADYENRLQQIDEAEAQRNWQSAENELARAFQTSEREQQEKWQSGENELARQFQTSEREQQQIYNTIEREKTQAYNTSEREAQQAYNTAERLGQQEWQTGENAAARAEQARQFDESLAFNKEQADIQKQQWEQEFGYTQKTTDQKIAMEYAMAILQNGQMPGDDLLAAAGLSAEDAAKMMAQVKSSGNGNGNGNGAKEKLQAELLTAAGRASNISTASNVVSIPTDASVINGITSATAGVNAANSVTKASASKSSSADTIHNAAVNAATKSITELKKGLKRSE